jgi:hypothetical protein
LIFAGCSVRIYRENILSSIATGQVIFIFVPLCSCTFHTAVPATGAELFANEGIIYFTILRMQKYIIVAASVM